MTDMPSALRGIIVDAIVAANTIAGSRVEAERFDPIDDGVPPLVNVKMDVRGSTETAGISPIFAVIATVAIIGTVQDVNRIDQIKDAVFGIPNWDIPVHITDYAETRAFDGKSKWTVGDYRLVVHFAWRESYTANPPSAPLTGIAIPVGTATGNVA